jgi:hypothetical protein
MSMGFRMTVFSAPAQNRTSPHAKLDCFPLQDQTEAETVAIGYRARALVFEQRVRRPLAIRDMRRFVNGGRRSRNTKGPAQDSFRGTVLQSELKFLVPSKRFPLPRLFSLQCFLNRSFGSVDSELL